MDALRNIEKKRQNSPVMRDRLSRLHQEHAKVMVVDDDQAMQNLLCEVLTLQGYKAVGYTLAEIAMDALSAWNDDTKLVVCDINMPGMNGLAFLDHVKRVRPDIAVIMISAFGTDKTSQEAKNRGALEFFAKPFQLLELNSAVHRALHSL